MFGVLTIEIAIILHRRHQTVKPFLETDVLIT